MEFNHISVLLNECIEGLNIKSDGIYVDGTLGGGGHSYEILKRLTTGRLVGIDQDTDALKAAEKRLIEFKDKHLLLANNNFSNIKDVLSSFNIQGIDGCLLDIGVSSYQLDEGDRGFSYMKDAPLDMRMDKTKNLDAYYIVNKYSAEELNNIIFNYGEERWAKRISEFIVAEREKKPIETTFDLVEVIKKAIPKSARRDGPHPAKRTFQAIRIEVNDELNVLKKAIADCADVLNNKGRLLIITFHSLEDRIVKNAFRELENPCICPPEFPVCMCKRVSKGKVITRKPIIPSNEELDINHRSRSAKLRIFERRIL